VTLFAGITSREILMDITDCESDAKTGIWTVPVKYGRGVVAIVAFGWSVLSVAAASSLLFVAGGGWPNGGLNQNNFPSGFENNAAQTMLSGDGEEWLIGHCPFARTCVETNQQSTKGRAINNSID
jgi:hypothetical protein